MTETFDQLEIAFDPTKEEGTQDGVLPKGAYVATIIDAKLETLRTGKGQCVVLTWEIQGGQYNGRYLWDRCIISHQSADATKFGRRKLKDICDAIGITDPVTDLSVLRLKPATIWVKIEQDENGEYPPQNRVGRVKPLAKPGNGETLPFNDEIGI